ncbi:MAG: sugar ABC transporter permease [Anaerolineae bacterium]|nr:sugar ABC transporter permease [Anaerolineae bacterium]
MQKAEIMTTVNRARSRGFFANRQNVGLLFALPAVLFSVVFFVIPLIMTVFMSLHDWPLLGEHRFIGLDNYVKLASDGQFWSSLWFTTRYTLVITPIIFILAFILATLVNLPLRFIGFFRTAFFIPVVIGLGTSSLLWVWMLNDRVGPIDGILLNLKLIPKSIVWLGEANSAMTWIIISVVWKTVGFTMVLLLTGMQAIPEELYQQAMVDGAGLWEKFRFITLPLLRRTVALAMVLSVIGSYLGFDQFYIMTRGGPQNTTISVVYWIFNNSFTYFRLGYGAALSIVLLVILVILSVIQLRLLRDETQY